ncbi:MAG: hypothetical protein AB7P50_17820 [Alphaproteobacteria bacterium]
MEFKFGTWNVNGRRLSDAHVEALRRHELDLLALQEVSEGFHAALSKCGVFDWSISSLDLRPPHADEGKSRRIGVSIFGCGQFRLERETAEVLENLRFPERTLVVRVRSAAGKATICSFHIPPGVSWGVVKPQTEKAIAEWLSEQEGSTIFGIDANAPKTDHPNAAENEWWWEDEPLLLGQKPLHQLRDAFREFVGERPDILEEIRRVRPSGPLAISHYRGRGSKRTACRYDFIFVSQDVAVDKVEYIFDQTLSDHALVVGQFAFRVMAHSTDRK